MYVGSNNKLYTDSGQRILAEDGSHVSIHQAVQMQYPRFCDIWPMDRNLLPAILALVRKREREREAQV